MKISYGLILPFVLCISACTFPHQKKSEGEKLIVEDFRGKEIILDKPAKRVICLIESALSGIYMLKRQHSLAGVPSSIYNKKLYKYYSRLDTRIMNKSLLSPGNWDFISLEQIVGLQPDLVIIWASQSDAIDNIEQFGIPVYAVMLHSFEDIIKEMEDFGVLLNCRERADSLVDFTKAGLEDISLKKSKEQTKSAYFMWAQGITETSGLESTVNELFEAAGVKNACNLTEEHVSVSIEKIYDWNPDLIVMWYNEKLDPVDILKDPLLQGLKAVKEGNVYELPDAFSCDFWTLKMQFPVKLIANWAYGEIQDIESLQQQLSEMYFKLYDNALIEK